MNVCAYTPVLSQTQEKHLVTVEIRDMGGALNGLSNTGTATISLTDINDNPPTFSEKSVGLPQKHQICL